MMMNLPQLSRAPMIMFLNPSQPWTDGIMRMWLEGYIEAMAEVLIQEECREERETRSHLPKFGQNNCPKMDSRLSLLFSSTCSKLARTTTRRLQVLGRQWELLNEMKRIPFIQCPRKRGLSIYAVIRWLAYEASERREASNR